MKQRIFMYLFVFSILLILFQYVNSKNIIDDYEKSIKQYKNKIDQNEKSITKLKDSIFDWQHFSMVGNEEAITYFERFGLDTNEVLEAVENAIYESNVYEGDDHPIVPYASMTKSKLLINTIQIINHKWVIADFSDSQNWGEVFLRYEVNNEGKVDLELVEHLLYPNF